MATDPFYPVTQVRQTSIDSSREIDEHASRIGSLPLAFNAHSPPPSLPAEHGEKRDVEYSLQDGLITIPATPARRDADNDNNDSGSKTARKKPERLPGSTSTQLVLTKSHPWYTLLQETVELRDKVFEKKLQSELKAANYIAQWEHTSAHVWNFLGTGSTFMDALAESRPSIDLELLQKQWAMLQESAQFMQKWQTQGKAELEILTDLEGRLAHKEDKLYSQLKDMISGPGMSVLEHDSDSGATLHYERLSDTSSEGDHPLVQEYHDKVGDLKLISEHIYDADADHQRRRFQHEHALLSGQLTAAQDQKDQEAYKAYIKSRAKDVRGFLEIKKYVDRLQAHCRKLKLKVEDFELPAFLDLSTFNERPPSQHRASTGRISKRWSPDAFLVFGGLDKQTRILLWRDKVRRAMEEEKTHASRSSSRTRVMYTPSHSASPTPDQSHPPFQPPALPPPPPPPLPAFLFEEAMAHRADESQNEDDVDERNIHFEQFQGDGTIERRYSEPNLRQALRERNRPTTQFLLEEDTSKSESGLEALRHATENVPSRMRILSMTQSTRQRCQTRDRIARVT